jgi:hypothetical protein
MDKRSHFLELLKESTCLLDYLEDTKEDLKNAKELLNTVKNNLRISLIT